MSLPVSFNHTPRSGNHGNSVFATVKVTWSSLPGILGRDSNYGPETTGLPSPVSISFCPCSSHTVMRQQGAAWTAGEVGVGQKAAEGSGKGVLTEVLGQQQTAGSWCCWLGGISEAGPLEILKPDATCEAGGGGGGIVGGQTICHRAGIAKLLRRWGQTGFLKTDCLLTLPLVICGHLTRQMLFPWNLSPGTAMETAPQ